jgi:neopullulanase
MRKLVIIFFALTVINVCQNIKIDKVEPPNWWAGMKKNKIQLMIYGKNLSGYQASFNTKNIQINSTHNPENTNYTFIDITILPGIKAGNYVLSLGKSNEKATISFPVYEREKRKKQYQGFTSEDIIYLLMPDRFADGDTDNEIIPGMINDFKPDDPIGRHGGDLEGIIKHLDYLSDFGVTALWLTPVIENNNSVSYHGYASTNLYKIDPRFGTNDKYKELVAKAHEKGIKIIYDHVSNHISINHPWMNDLPEKDWINGTKENHLRAWHDKMVQWDIHGVQVTKDYLTKGWFVDEMPDLNQANPFVKNYLIQNMIWWIESTGLDGIREDTYPYVDATFLSQWAKEILNEYPALNIVGEIWEGETVFLAPYQKDSRLNTRFNSNLPVVTDFMLQNSYEYYLKNDPGFYKIYYTLAKDYLYENPNNLLIFADNHDSPRAMFTAKENIDKVKLVYAHLLTTRGIPQLLYGSELAMVGNEKHGVLRANFRGGFQGDSSDAFTVSGRTQKENDMYNYLRKLIHLRKKYLSFSLGDLHHLPPQNNVYTYTRKYKDERTLVLINCNDKQTAFDCKLLDDLCGKISAYDDILNSCLPEIKNGQISLKPMSANVFLIK